MVLIATGLAVALASALSAGAAPASLPPIVVSVVEAPGVPAAIVTNLLAEAAEIWRAVGVAFRWERSAARGAVPDPRTPDTGPVLPSRLRVIVGNDRGAARDHRTPLGWIVFEGEHHPLPEIYLSHWNATTLLAASRTVVGIFEQMPLMRREQLIGRAMGRALAHELGHYLLASKVHTKRGVLQASRTAGELFGQSRDAFSVDLWQRHTIAARLTGEPAVARWEKPGRKDPQEER
jgi:hypothetical protein